MEKTWDGRPGLTRTSGEAAYDPELRHLPLLVSVSCLLKADLFYERVAATIRRQPLNLLLAIKDLFRGTETLDARLVSQDELDLRALPLDEAIAKWLVRPEFRVRKIVLLTNSPSLLNERLAERLNMFAQKQIALESLRLKTASSLEEEFPTGFVYAGRSRADLEVWKKAAGIILCRASPHIADAARELGKPILAEFPPPRSTPFTLLRAFRFHQWVKNLLIFAPAFFANAVIEPSVFLRCALGFVLLGVVASATYLLNDVLDLEADRRHWSKAARPFAAGDLHLSLGFILPVTGIAFGILGASWLSPPFAAVLAAYIVLNLSYSFILKLRPIVDVFCIAGLYVLRLVMGTVLAEVPFSPWLLTFAMLFFLSLALAKRHTEIKKAYKSDGRVLRARGYKVSDAPLTLALGVASSTASLVIMILYLTGEVFGQTLYHHPARLWAVPMVLALWTNRIWLFAHRGELDDDPIHFALRDPISLVLGFSVLFAFISAIL